MPESMLDPLFQKAGELHASLVNFVEVAAGDIADAKAGFAARQIARSPQLDSAQRKLFDRRFALEGEVDRTSVIDLFLASRGDLSAIDRALVSSWSQGFMGLLAIVAVYPNGLEVMNWLTAKHYRIQFADLASLQATTRLKVGEVILAQIIPVRDIDWLISTPWISLGSLGKPKLAVAIGTFRQNYPHYLYADAPELLAAAWDSVMVYHDRFVSFFGSDEITLPGRELERQLAEFQQLTIDRQLDEAGVDKSKSLAELAIDAGMEGSELKELTAQLGVPGTEVERISATSIAQMVAPTSEFPPQLKHAERLTAMSDRYWGQMLLPEYDAIDSLLAQLTPSDAISPAQLQLLQKALAQPQFNAHLWRKLSAKYPQQLTTAFSKIARRDDFNLSTDLNDLLTKFNKILLPDLPDIASVPIHLHNLFQAAIQEVSKPKQKSKPGSKKGGFATKS
jgi:hypothetical protein